MADREAGRCARAGQADEVLGGNVRYEQRRADKEPSDIAAGEKVVGGGALFAREVEADTKDHQEINADDDQVERGQRTVSSRCGCIHDGLVGLHLRIALPGLLERFSSELVAAADGHSMR